MSKRETAGEALTSDLAVATLSNSLSSYKIDLVVTGSIAAVESVRFIRALRRLGAQVRVVMSEGAKQFVGPTALEWAAASPVQTEFSGTISHLAENDALVIAPASANFLTGIARGESDTAAKALVQSYLGAKKPVMVLPCMHESLARSPFYLKAIDSISDEVNWLAGRHEEGKNKFPEPLVLADLVAHRMNQRSTKVLITMGGTRAAIDDVRYIGNVSTGALGTEITHELYRHGFQTHVVAAAAEIKPHASSHYTTAVSPQAMYSAVEQLIRTEPWDAMIFAAAVADYEPVNVTSGKIRSGADQLRVDLRPTAKIIELAKNHQAKKIGFKLEPELNDQAVKKIFVRYQLLYKLDAMILNQIGEIAGQQHRAWLIDQTQTLTECHGKRGIAQTICTWLTKELEQ